MRQPAFERMDLKNNLVRKYSEKVIKNANLKNQKIMFVHTCLTIKKFA